MSTVELKRIDEVNLEVLKKLNTLNSFELISRALSDILIEFMYDRMEEGGHKTLKLLNDVDTLKRVIESISELKNY